jgi:hypothetical protein
MIASPMLKNAVWADLVNHAPLPECALPSYRLRASQLALDDDEKFWRLFLDRGELRNKTVSELEPVKRERVVRHFTSRLFEKARELGWRD